MNVSQGGIRVRTGGDGAQVNLPVEVVSCPECFTKYKVMAKHFGRLLRCFKCSAEFALPIPHNHSVGQRRSELEVYAEDPEKTKLEPTEPIPAAANGRNGSPARGRELLVGLVLGALLTAVCFDFFRVKAVSLSPRTVSAEPIAAASFSGQSIQPQDAGVDVGDSTSGQCEEPSLATSLASPRMTTPSTHQAANEMQNADARSAATEMPKSKTPVGVVGGRRTQSPLEIVRMHRGAVFQITNIGSTEITVRRIVVNQQYSQAPPTSGFPEGTLKAGAKGFFTAAQFKDAQGRSYDPRPGEPIGIAVETDLGEFSFKLGGR